METPCTAKNRVALTDGRLPGSDQYIPDQCNPLQNSSIDGLVRPHELLIDRIVSTLPISNNSYFHVRNKSSELTRN
jgi:hypothetical protein